MAVRFTPQQQEVIDLRGCNILVSAAAGSGKTAVLTQRIVERISDETNPVDIDRLLVLTFTKAAAAEMRERIGLGITQRLEANPGSRHLQRQATLLHNAQITTIDSFCLFLVKNHFQEIGLDPAFRVADEGEGKLLSQEVLGELLEDRFQEGKEDFLHCVEVLCPNGKEQNLEKQILELSRYAASFPWPRDWLRDRKRDYSCETVEELKASKAWQFRDQYVKSILQGCLETMERGYQVILEPDGPGAYEKVFTKEIEAYQRLVSCENMEQLERGIGEMTFDSLPGKKAAGEDPAKRGYAKDLRDQAKKSFGELKSQFYFCSPEQSLERERACGETLQVLIDLVLEYNERLQKRKQEKKVIDFSDMEHYALEILWRKEEDRVVPTDVAKQYREYFREILVDEYQDSNLVQEYLLMALSGEENGNYNRFMVGDVKQSIYRFRLARPELFLAKYHQYGTTGPERRIDLSKNFRSRETVISTVNRVFGALMSTEVGGIDYDERAALYPGAQYPECEGLESELLVLQKPEDTWNVTEREAEALMIAERIRELKASGQVTDKATGMLRPIQNRDIVILLRSLTGWGEEFKSALEKKGIPVYITTKSGYFDATEVQNLLNYLRVLDNPRQDIPLYGSLVGVFGGYTREEIAVLKADHRGESLYQALCQDPSPKAAAFLERLERYRNMAEYLPVRDLIARVIEDFDYRNLVTVLPGGSKRRANVEMLLVKAGDFEKTSYFGLFHFIRYMEQLEKYEMDYGEADLLDENADVVRIMSIHKSKGLEFPVVFVSGMAKKFNFQDLNQSIILDMDLGLGMDDVDPVARTKFRTIRKNAISKKMREETLGEELRLLYVALTRPKEKVILTGVMEDPGEELLSEAALLSHSRDKLSYTDYMKAGCFLDFLLPVLETLGLSLMIKTMEELGGRELSREVDKHLARERLVSGAVAYDEELRKTLEERFAFVYPYENLSQLYTKTTVSELKMAAMTLEDEAASHAFEERETKEYIPAFRRQAQEVTGTVRGNAYHRVMELMDFRRILFPEGAEPGEDYVSYRSALDQQVVTKRLGEWLLEMRESLRLKEEYYHAISPEKIRKFLESELGYRMWRAWERGQLHREQPFVLALPASRLKPEFPEEEKVLIQGIIDVYFEEDGELVLLDYKTDSVPDMESLWKRYSVQLEYYREALERLTGKKVKESLLYSFHLER